MAENINNGQQNESTSKMPYMCPMMYYGTYPVPMQDMNWPPSGMMFHGCSGPCGNMYRPMPPFMYGGGYYNVPFPESGDS